MFVYYNANPEGKIIGDCVTRAISFALDMDYYEVVDLLYKNSDYFNCDMLVRDCYGKALSLDFGLPQYDGMGRTVAEVANDFSNNILILRIDNHLTCSKYGNIYDIWDPSNEIVDCFWVVDYLR